MYPNGEGRGDDREHSDEQNATLHLGAEDIEEGIRLGAARSGHERR